MLHVPRGYGPRPLRFREEGRRVGLPPAYPLVVRVLFDDDAQLFQQLGLVRQRHAGNFYEPGQPVVQRV